MKKILFFILLHFYLNVNVHSQIPQFPPVVGKPDRAALIGSMGPCVVSVEMLIENGAWLVVNNVLVTEKKHISYFFQKYKTQYHGSKYYDENEGIKKLGIVSKKGILSCRIKHVIINLE